MRSITKIALATFTAVVLSLSVAYVPDYFEISKQIDIFTTIFKEVNLYYVDETQPGELMDEAIESMLKSLDPYTNYIPEEMVEDYKIQTTGHYGGIGATIQLRDDQLIITNAYEGFAADKAGLKPGDIILMIDGNDVSGKSTDDVSKILKGAPGTEVEIKYKREEKVFEKTIERDDVQVRSVPYYGMLENDIAYISLSSFTDKASRDIKNALSDLKEENEVKGIVLDLRGNPGGLLTEAVNVTNIFIDKNQEVVKTKGKLEEWEKTYKTLNQPQDTETPLAVLINRGSASASEIVAGTLQDYDRAVIIGQRSFGKGLVQQTRKLSYGAQLKVTIAKYYTPSGRCIQAINYAERDEDGSVKKIPDSLRTRFETLSGRPVYDGGGIDPDVEIDEYYLSAVIRNLFHKMLIFDYATEYARTHESIADAKDFRLTDKEYQDFLAWLDGHEFEYKTDTERRIELLIETAEKEGYSESLAEELSMIREEYHKEENTDLVDYADEIKQLLAEEIVSRYFYDSGRIANSLKNDPEVKRSLEVLVDESEYQSILSFAAN